MQSNELLVHFGSALLLTIVLEEAVAVFFFGTKWIGYLLVLLVNVVTNPVLNIIYRWIYLIYPVPPYSLVIIVLEMVVVWAEYRLICHGLNSNEKRWFFLSLAANTFSYTIGLVFCK